MDNGHWRPGRRIMRPGRDALGRGRGRRSLLVAGLGTLALLAGGRLGLAAEPHLQLMIHRAFAPGGISVHRGDSIYIVNDDGITVHHPYVRSPTFSFDAGDLEPGHDAKLVFPADGTFTVICAIHPSLRSKVQVAP